MALFTIEVIGRVEVVHKVEFPEAAILAAINQLEQRVIMNQQELNQTLTTVQGALTEAGTEISTKIQTLSDQLAAAGNLTPENEALVNDIKARAQALADIVPNEPPNGG